MVMVPNQSFGMTIECLQFLYIKIIVFRPIVVHFLKLVEKKLWEVA